MRRRGIILGFLLGTLVGCQALSPFANRRITAKFDEVDSIEVITLRETLTVIEDAESIARIKKIYENSQWTPWIATKPSNFRTLVCKRGKEPLLKLVLTTWLIELDDSGGWIRKATLNEEDKQWLSSVTNPNL